VLHLEAQHLTCVGSSIHQGGIKLDVRQSAIDRTAGFEAFVSHMYLDTGGKVTAGYGHMLPNALAVSAIVMKLNGNNAIQKDKEKEWTLIKSKEVGHPASYYKQFTKLTMSEDDGKSLLRADLTDAAADLARRFPVLDDFPETAQDELLDMMFNIGLTKFTKTKWPKLFAAVEKQDWKSAADASNRPDVGVDRNKAIYDLFISASALALMAETALADEGPEVAGALFDRRALTILKLISSGQECRKFFPNGIERIRLDVKVGHTKIGMEISGSYRADTVLGEERGALDDSAS
jgi:GH24 family phage-related lysozyme (muramidase)